MNTTDTLLWFAPLAVLLLVFHGLLVALELALIRLRLSHFDQARDARLEARPALQRLLDSPGKAVKVARLAMAGCLGGYFLLLVPITGELLATLMNGEALRGLAAGIAFVLALILHHLVGELVPRGLGLAYAENLLMRAGWILVVIKALLAPIAAPLEAISNGLIRNRDEDEPIDEDEPDDFEALDLEAQLEAAEEEKVSTGVAERIVRNALNIRDLVVSDILLPRHQVQYFDLEDGLEYNLDFARKTGHTRFPLCQGDLDRCIGIVHIKDVFRYGGDLSRLDLRRIRRPIINFGPDDPLEQALPRLLAQKMHMALVVDEFGGTQGILTLERILEQLVGDIQDEFDAEEAPIRPIANGEFVVSGLAALHEIEEHLDVEIDNEEVSTFSGLITSEIGRIPDQGERLEVENLAVTITQVDEKRVIEARVSLTELSEGKTEEKPDETLEQPEK